MPEPTLHKYFDFGERAMSDLTLASGERVFLSILPSGFATHRTHLSGMIPGRRLFGASADATARMVRVIGRDADLLPPLPTAHKHRDDSAMADFLAAATVDLRAAAENKPIPGRVEALDLENRPERPLSLLTRLALTAVDAVDLARRFERACNTPG